jgi:2-polyprenyl-6-methoxyphenol hydroxylase-like FAD-dependent oxidoreductase
LEAVLMERALALPNVRVVRPASFVDILRDGATGRASGSVIAKGMRHRGLDCRLVVAADGQHSRFASAPALRSRPITYDHAYFGLESERPHRIPGRHALHFHPEGGALLMPHPDRIGVGILVEAGECEALDDDGRIRVGSKLAKRAPYFEAWRSI